MTPLSLIVIAIGASLGAWLRHLLGVAMNAWYPMLPLGTLSANLVGGYLIGVVIVLLARFPEFDPHWRLLLVTGVLGGLTTFSTFSAENITLLMNGRLVSAGLHLMAHVSGSLFATWLGVLSARAWFHLFLLK